jgi:molybdopterin-guanine dinucleotide biosynthesis protein A
MIEDNRKGMGPLAGMEAGLLASTTERNLIVACDMPFLSIEIGKYLLKSLEDYQAVVPEIAGQMHPLFAAYRKETVQQITHTFAQNQLRIRSFLENIHVKLVNEETLETLGLPNEELYFYNMNHPEEYQKALQILKNQK